jgi:hypothetical protein
MQIVATDVNLLYLLSWSHDRSSDRRIVPPGPRTRTLREHQGQEPPRGQGRSQGAARIDAAVANASDLTYEQYVSLVVAYLDPDQAEIYSSREAWEMMQLDVIERLEALR